MYCIVFLLNHIKVVFKSYFEFFITSISRDNIVVMMTTNMLIYIIMRIYRQAIDTSYHWYTFKVVTVYAWSFYNSIHL